MRVCLGLGLASEALSMCRGVKGNSAPMVKRRVRVHWINNRLRRFGRPNREVSWRSANHRKWL